MSALIARGLSFSWPDGGAVLSGVDLHLDPGWTGLVGGNGAGKTTLLRLILGELEPTAGSVDRPQPVICCRQGVEQLDPAIQAFAWGFEGIDPWVWQERLALDPADLERWASLSPGERKRWQLGAALSRGARTLLLDEPSNHLDAQGVGLVIEALRAFDGVGLLVSHDRRLLDAITHATVELRGGTARVFPGAYGRARAAWDLGDQQQREQADRLSAEARGARRALAAARQDAAAADRATSSRRRMKSPQDSDGRSMAAKFRAEKGAARAGQAASLARELAERAAERAAAAAPPDKTLGRSVFLDYAQSPKDPLLTRTGDAVRVGDRVLLHDVHLALGRGEHVHLAGHNGAGKTTLLRALLDEAALPAEHVLFLPQELSPEQIAADLETLHGLEPTVRGRVLQLVAALGVPPARLLATSSPSPGEARKLALALGMGRHAWLLVLDEPGNHLDLPSVERLEQALAAFPGALLLVTHDAALAAATCATRWEIVEGRVEVGSVG